MNLKKESRVYLPPVSLCIYFPYFISLVSVDASFFIQSTVSHFLSLATDLGSTLGNVGKEKTGDGAIGIVHVGGGYHMAAAPLSRLSLRSLPRRYCRSA